MRRVLQVLGLLGFFALSSVSTHAFAQDPPDDDKDTEADANHNTEEPKEAEKPAAVLPSAPPAPPAAATATSAATAATADVPAAATPKPKFGDVAFSGYFRGGFGASNQKGRMTCFSLALPGGLVSKYRLGNECEVWAEAHFTTVVYAGDDGTVAHFHFMPTAYLPTTYIGYSPNTTTSSPAQFTTSTGATVSFPNLYADIQGIPWLSGGTAWVGSRYYKRESVYISDFFYWNPSGVGAGIEDINLNKDLRLSYAAFAVDGDPAAPANSTAPQLHNQADFGVRNDVQLRGIKPYASGEIQIGFQYIANYSNDPATNGGWGVTLQHVQKLLGGDNKLAFQYGRGGGTGFGTLSRFYYPDFSLNHVLAESRLRIVDVATVQPTEAFGAQVNFVYQHDNFGDNQTQDWFSTGARLSYGFTRYLKLLGEVGYDHVKKNNGAQPQKLAKFTIAPTLSTGKGLLARPEIRLFYTWATWNGAAQTATIDSGRLYTDTYPNLRSGAIFGVQGETWF
jgi:maltoporin